MHNICTGGCKGLSDTPGVCQTDGCLKHEQPLTSCDCADDKHYGQHDDKASHQDGESGESGE